MALSIAFRWNGVNVAAPRPMAERENLAENLGRLGQSVAAARERSYRRDQDARAAERQAEIDRMNAEDRQRRIDEDERQKRLYGETADLIRGKMAERQELVQRRKELQGRIDALKARLGG